MSAEQDDINYFKNKIINSVNNEDTSSLLSDCKKFICLKESYEIYKEVRQETRQSAPPNNPKG